VDQAKSASLPSIADRTGVEIAALIRDNLRQYYRCLGRSPAVVFYEDGELGWLSTGITPLTYLNAVYHTRLPTARVDQAVHAMIAWFRAHEVQRFSWWVDESSRPVYLPAFLQAHRLFYVRGEAGMALDLRLAEIEAPALPNLCIERVADQAQLGQFAAATIRGFELPPEYAAHWYAIHAGLEGDETLRSYLATLDGEPVGCAQLFLGVEAAGIYDVAVVPGCRGLGLGRLLTLFALREARSLGADLAVLHASQMGEGLYLRLGFREYCRMGRFVWDGEHGVGLENHVERRPTADG
jgi:ribosomal protein S18 acetylase RimI-like enzyme